jgi:hypothetical protein
VRHLTAELCTAILQARQGLVSARESGDVDRVLLNEKRLRYLSEAVVEYGIVLAEPSSRLRVGGHAATGG